MILKRILRGAVGKGCRHYSEVVSRFGILNQDEVNKSVTKRTFKVAVLGADTPAGFYTAFLLKQNPLLSHLYLYGSGRVVPLAEDLKHLDTKCKVIASYNSENIPDVLRAAEIIAIMGQDDVCPRTPWMDMFYSESKRVIELAETCVKYNPRAILLVCASPVSCTLPLVSSVYRETDWYHPGKIIGSAAITEVKANALLASYNELEPEIVQTPLTGGPDLDCAVPLFAQAYPVECWESDEKVLWGKFKELEEDECPFKTGCNVKPAGSYLLEAHGTTRLITLIGLGLRGDSTAIGKGFVRQSFLPNCKYLTCTVQFGPEGVIHNFGVPFLNSSELELLERTMVALAYREYIAEEHYRKTKKTLAEFSCSCQN